MAANLITDVAGLKVGHADDARVKSGVTVVVCDEPAIAAVHVMGGAPGTRETDLLSPEQTVERVDAVFLSGGSVFGLDAGAGIVDGLTLKGRGFAVGPLKIPIVPGAILFDLINGGDKNWGSEPPYRRLGRAAFDNAAANFALGSVGAGTGATTANLKGGVGSASGRLSGGATIGALVVVNALGQATIGDTRHFWAAPFEVGKEFGGRGMPAEWPAEAARLRHKGQAAPQSATTIAVIATDAELTKAEAKRLAIASHDGFARALWPAHTAFDGDLVFALSTGRAGRADPVELGAAAASTMARAIARGVYEAAPALGDLLPAWRQAFG